MTNKDYLLAQLGFTPSNSNVVEAALIDNGITGSTNYSSSQKVLLKTAAIQVLQILLSTADVEQGSDDTRQSIKYDRNAIAKRISELQVEVGVIDPDPVIKAIHVW
jgi:hypothetical protein